MPPTMIHFARLGSKMTACGLSVKNHHRNTAVPADVTCRRCLATLPKDAAPPPDLMGMLTQMVEKLGPAVNAMMLMMVHMGPACEKLKAATEAQTGCELSKEETAALALFLAAQSRK